MSGVASLETLRRRAIHIKREFGLKHHAALNAAATERGYQNYAHAVRAVDGDGVTPSVFPVTLSQFWSNRDAGLRGNEQLKVTLASPLDEFIQKRHLVGYLGGVKMFDKDHLVLPFHLYPDDSAEGAMERLRRVARTLEFMQVSGLYPSTAVRCYPHSDWENRPPIADHDHCWYHPQTRAFVLTTEPYPGVRERRPEHLAAWRERFGYELQKVEWGSIYGHGTELWAAVKTGGLSLSQISDRLLAKPSLFSG